MKTQTDRIAGSETHEHVGHTTIGRTVYQIFRLPLGDNTKRAGVRGNYALVGANGAQYLVTDHDALATRSTRLPAAAASINGGRQRRAAFAVSNARTCH